MMPGRWSTISMLVIVIVGWSVAEARAQCAPIPLDNAGAAQACLDGATQFFADSAAAFPNASSPGLGFTDFSDLLPPDYESAGKYSETEVDQVIQWAIASSRVEANDVILYEAALRQASAHGMWADEALLRGLDPNSGGGAAVSPEEVTSSALQRLDSRVCQGDISPPVVTTTLCSSDRSCSGSAPVCAPRGYSFGGDPLLGPFGAIQEYRRAEQALLVAIQTLGITRFREIDESQPLCLDLPCASRLLVRIGAMKARAQAERAELLWRRSVARTGVLADTLVCSAGDVGALCVVNADCDIIGSGTITTLGVCGDPASVAGSRAETDAVLLREFVQEAIAEAAIAEAVYRELLREDEIGDLSDWSMRFAALSRIETIEERSFAGQNPFGLPSDYVPILRNTQQDLLDCLSTCTSGGSQTCDATSNLQCLRNLVERADLTNLFELARTAQDNATQNAQAYADRALNRQAQRDDMDIEFRRVVVRLLGEPSCSGASCSCPAGDEGSLCVAFDDEAWVAEGLVCDVEGLSSEVPTCSLTGVDGELERQFVAVQASNLAVDDKLRELSDNLEQMEFEERKFATFRGLKAQECQDVETAIVSAQQAVSSAIKEREENKKTKKGWFGRAYDQVKSGVGKVREKIADNPYLDIGLNVFIPIDLSSQLCSLGLAQKAASSKGAADGASVAVPIGCDLLNGAAEKKKKKAELQFEEAKVAIDFAQQLDTVQARCRTELGEDPTNPDACNADDPFSCGILGIQQGEALRQLTLRRREITADLAQARIAYVDALSASEQLMVQFRESIARFSEAQEQLAIQNAVSFRNPANYRAVALREQLEAVDKFRAAQIVAWMITRAVAYDLAAPDTATSDLTPLQLSSCQAARCDLLSDNGGSVCFGDEDCVPGVGGVGGVCELSSDPNGIADASGDCSLQAVFAARTVDDLEAIVSSAVTQVVAADRALACNAGVCQKTIRLRDLYSDPFEPASSRPNLGDLLIESRPSTDPDLAVLGWAISPRRGFLRCPPNADGVGLTCQTAGVANLSGEQANSGNDASNIWNARVLSVEGTVVYQPNRNPGQILCRDPQSGKLANSNPAVCQDLFGSPTPGVSCPLEDPSPSGITGCFNAFGFPSACDCQRLLTTPEAPVEARIRQVQPGIVRARSAPPFAPPSTEDRFLRFTMRSGDLPIVGNTLTDRVPSFDPFSVPLTLADADDTGNPPTKQTEIKGVPMASPGWEIRIRPQGRLLRPEDFDEEFIRSIQDIELTFEYQGFVIQ